MDDAGYALTVNTIDRLNRECFCLPLAAAALEAALGRRLPAAELSWAVPRLASLSAGQPLFLPLNLRTELFDRIRAVGAVLLARAVAGGSDRTRLLAAAAFDSFDFHLCTDGPKLIEINSNAGGAFLQPLLLEALAGNGSRDGFRPEQVLIDAFSALAPGRPLQRVAIVDSKPTEQALYLDMRLAAAALQARGIEVAILDRSELTFSGGRLQGPQGPIDLVYNRLTDFELTDPAHAALRAAWQSGAAVVVPNPEVYRAFAAKSLLVELSDPERLADLARAAQVEPALVRDTVPPSFHLDAADAERIWTQRRDYVFKPGQGYGSRGVYRGDKISRSRWQSLLGQGYLAQRFAAPSQRLQPLTDSITAFKVDVRVWTHGIEPLFASARLYAGQVMGFQNEGAGFAPILWVDPAQAGRACSDVEGFQGLCRRTLAGSASEGSA